MVWRLQKQNTRTSKARKKSAREAAPDVPSQDVATPVKDQQEPEDGEGDVHVEYAIGDYVAAKYNRDMYVGRVANIDDEEYEINFMECIPRLSFHYRWPTRRDLLWVHPICVLCKLSEPLPTGRSQRAFTLVPRDQNILSNLS